MHRPQRPPRLVPPTKSKYVILTLLAALLLIWLAEKFL